MIRRLLRYLAGVVLILPPAIALSAPEGPPIPAPSGFVTDKANIIERDHEKEIVALLDELERRAKAEVAVLTLRSTQPASDIEYARRVFERWRVGRSGTQRGVLVLVVLRDRRVSIVPGPGVEKIFPEARIEEIIDERFVPVFKKGHYGRGILEGVWAIAEDIAIDARVKLKYELSPVGDEDSKKSQLTLFGKFIKALVALLIAGIFWVVWNDYRGKGKIKTRGEGDSGGDSFGGGARGW